MWRKSFEINILVFGSDENYFASCNSLNGRTLEIHKHSINWKIFVSINLRVYRCIFFFLFYIYKKTNWTTYASVTNVTRFIVYTKRIWICPMVRTNDRIAKKNKRKKEMRTLISGGTIGGYSVGIIFRFVFELQIKTRKWREIGRQTIDQKKEGKKKPCFSSQRAVLICFRICYCGCEGGGGHRNHQIINPSSICACR